MNFRRFLHRSSTLLLLITFWSHNSASYAQDNDFNPTAAVNAITDFGWDFYKQVRQENEGKNIFYSPASISTALTMVYVGAQGQTAEQMSQVLHLPEPGLAAMDFGHIFSRLPANENENGYTLSTANKLWVSEQLQLNPSFLQSMYENFRSEVEKSNFLAPSETAQKINSWVATNTNGKIPEIIDSSMITRDMVLFLANAVYFKGQWETAFKPQFTSKQPFYLDDAREKQVLVDTMERQGNIVYGENDKVKAVKLPFKGDVAMTIILPKDGTELVAVENKLSRGFLTNLSKDFYAAPVQIFLPKFTMRSSYDLRDYLSNLGMPLAFSDGADFSGIAAGERLRISHAIHKGFVAVDEQGAEAAAATGIGVSRTSVSVPVEFRVDRPFIFVIHTKDNLPLFIGRIVNPTISE